MITKATTERYLLTSSPFYRMGRQLDLANILGISPKILTTLIVKRVALYYYKTEVINGKERALAVPINEMRGIHERLKGLLGRIILPDYLYSPRRGRSANSNALVHADSNSIIKLDIRQFYPSTTDEHVFQFFYHRLKMASDVAGRLTKICTIDGRVPFGSPLSPILCALVHDDIFTKAASRCAFDGNIITLWVDDITLSGERVRTGLVRDVKRLISSKRLHPHKGQKASSSTGTVITGTYVRKGTPAPSNKTHLKIRDKLHELKTTTSTSRRLELVRSLIGLINHVITIYPNASEQLERSKSLLSWLHLQRRQLDELGGRDPEAKFDRLSPNAPPISPWE